MWDDVQEAIPDVLTAAVHEGSPEKVAEIYRCVESLRSEDALRAIKRRFDEALGTTEASSYDIGRLQRNACAILLTGAAACLIVRPPPQNFWNELIRTLADAAGLLAETEVSADLVRKAVSRSSNFSSDPALEASRALAAEGLPTAAVRHWTQEWLRRAGHGPQPANRPLRATIAAVVNGRGELGDLSLEQIDDTDSEESSLIEHPKLALRPLRRDLIETIHAAWNSGAAKSSVVWNITLKNPELPQFLPLAGPSLGGAAHAAFRTLAQDGDYEPSCLIAAAVAADGQTLEAVGGRREKILEAVRSWHGRQDAKDRIHTVILADTKESQDLQQEFAALNLDVHPVKTVAAAMESASGMRTGLEAYYQSLIGDPDRISEKFAYLGGRKLPALHVPMDVFEIEHVERKQPKDNGEETVPNDETPKSRVTWLSVVENMRKQPGSGVVLTAQGGYGKSQLWRMTLRELAEEGSRTLRSGDASLHSLPLPVGLTCAALTEAPNEEALLALVSGKFRTHSAALAKHVRERIMAAKNGDVGVREGLWLVLDALDQVGTDSSRQDAIESALEIVDRWGCRIILTSRPPAYENKVATFQRLKTFQRLHAGTKRVATEHRLAPLSPEQKQDFIAHWFKDDALQQKMWGWLERQTSAMKMSDAPFLLTLLCWASDRFMERQAAVTRPEIYDTVVRSMLRTLPDGATQETRDNDLLPLLAETVWRLFPELIGNNFEYITDTDLLDTLKDANEEAAAWRKGEPVNQYSKKSAARDHIDELVDKRVLLPAGDYPLRYEFPHRSVAEYFAAYHLAKHPEGWRATVETAAEKFLPKKIRYREKLPGLPPNGWEEPVVMGAGLAKLRKRDAYIENVRRTPNPVIAARCAEEIGHAIGEELKKKLQTDLLSMLEDQTVYVRARIAAAEALGEIGDPRWEGLEREGPFGAYILPRMVAVPAGEYPIGDNNSLVEDERPAHKVKLESFGLGQYAVTNMEYRCFIESGHYDSPLWWNGHPEDAEGDPNFWDDSRFNRKTQPVVGISWFEAMAYCRWLTANVGQEGEWKAFRLPTEVEHEAAARGSGKGGRRYAYDENDYDPMKANTGDILGQTTPVGIYRATQIDGAKEGAFDLTGNVWCWTLSIYDPKRFRYPYKPGGARENPNDRDANRSLRGGSWNSSRVSARAACRLNSLPSLRFNLSLGFRVVGVVRPPSR